MLEHSAGKPASFTSDFEGAIDLCNSSGMRGWARDKNSENPVFVSVYIDGTPVCTAVADDVREDGPANGDAAIRCGFHMPVPERYIDGRVHHFRVSILHSNPQFVIADLSVRLLMSQDKKETSSSRSVVFHQPNHTQNKDTAARAIVGKNRWLFLADDSNKIRDQLTGKYILPSKFLDHYRNIFTERRERLAQLGIPYVFFSAPSKELVCEDRLPEGMSIERGKLPIHLVREALLKDGFEIRMLEPHLKSAEAKFNTYYRTDTHWNYLGAHAAYQAIIEHLGQFVDCGKPVPREGFTSKKLRNWRGDLSNKEKLVSIGDGGELAACSPFAFTHTEFEEDVEQLIDESGDVSDAAVPDIMNISKTRASLVKQHKNPALPRVVFFRDSFTTLLAPMLARNFSRSSFLWVPEMVFPVIESEKPDIVVQIMVDRFSVRPPANVG